MIMIDDWWLWFMIMIYDDVQPSIPIPIPTPAYDRRQSHHIPNTLRLLTKRPGIEKKKMEVR